MVERKGDRWRFDLRCPGARWVCLVGDFNQWSRSQTPMHPAALNHFVCHLKLPPGKYCFRYLTSNRGWLTDWAAFGVEKNYLGEWDSVLYVPPAHGVIPPPSPTITTEVHDLTELPVLLNAPPVRAR
ncbi:MAG: hypothetical protein GC162_15985 [Planctomycetes bacterium]|nr:hypothetical protein [Planctomycetota bacterium]